MEHAVAFEPTTRVATQGSFMTLGQFVSRGLNPAFKRDERWSSILEDPGQIVMDTNVHSKVLMNPRFTLLSAVTEKPPPKRRYTVTRSSVQGSESTLLHQDRN